MKIKHVVMRAIGKDLRGTKVLTEIFIGMDGVEMEEQYPVIFKPLGTFDKEEDALELVLYILDEEDAKIEKPVLKIEKVYTV